MADPVAKRARTQEPEEDAAPKFATKPGPGLNPKHFTAENQLSLEKEIADSEPYKYGIISGLIDEELLKRARDEILNSVHFTQKETDIYRVNQTGDLANLDRLDASEQKQLENLGKVRAALYSPEFRALMSKVTRCGPLSGKIQDLSVNLYDKGCHLLNHDDVIGTRKVSYILYLVPPDEKWDPKWGGALRLYPTIKAGVPAPDWTVSIPPAWNQLSFFKIQPGRSFHDVEEVYVNKPRLSISGWFHVPQEGEDGYGEDADDDKEDRDKAGLAQLSRSHDSNEGYLPQRHFEPYTGESDLSEQEITYLRKYINSSLLTGVTQEKYAKEFANNSMVQCSDFLNEEFSTILLKSAEQLDLERAPQTSSEVKQPWNTARPPHLRRYLYLESEDQSRLTELRSLFNSAAMGHLLEKLTSLTIESRYVELRRFRPGQDFTLASTSGMDKPLIELVYTFTPARWKDNVGGYDLVMPGSEDNDDPAIYRAAESDDAVLLSEEPSKNCLTVIFRDEDILRFFKYVSRNAPGSRFDVLGEYIVKD